MENVGNLLIPAGTQMTDRMYLSANGGLDDFATDPWLTSFRTQLAVDLLPGKSVTRTETVQLPENIEGELQILVYVNADNEVFEGRRNELDSNIGGALVAVYPEPRELGGAEPFHRYSGRNKFTSGQSRFVERPGDGESGRIECDLSRQHLRQHGTGKRS